MGNQFNAVKFFETYAKIIAEREGVDIKVTVRRRCDDGDVFHKVGDVRYRRSKRTVR